MLATTRPMYRQANLNLLRAPHVLYKMKSHYRAETRTKKTLENAAQAPPPKR